MSKRLHTVPANLGIHRAGFLKAGGTVSCSVRPVESTVTDPSSLASVCPSHPGGLHLQEEHSLPFSWNPLSPRIVYFPLP